MKISVVTICFNERAGIRNTVESVLAQTHDNFEYIVIDGASTDGTTGILSRYADHIDRLISEPDHGIYDAMNKALAHCSGDYVVFINGGDRFYDEHVLQQVRDYSPETDIVYGDIAFEHTNGDLAHRTAPSRVDIIRLAAATIWHPASLTKRSLFARIGGFNEKFHTAADYEFFCRAILAHHASTTYLPITMAIFNTQGVSSDAALARARRLQRRSIQRMHFPLPYYAAAIVRDFLKRHDRFPPAAWLRRFASNAFTRIHNRC